MTNNVIIKNLIKETLNRENNFEIDVTRRAVVNLKKTRLGIFQNEVDYRFLLPEYKPLKTNSRSAVDLLGFIHGGFCLVEFKLFDETKPKSYHHWSALYHLKSDIEKLENAANGARINSSYPIKFLFVFAIRNSKRILNKDQLEKAIESYTNNQGKNPRVSNFNQYTVLKSIEYLRDELWPNWDFQFLHKKEDSFLIGSFEINETH